MGDHPQARTRGGWVRMRIGPPPLTDTRVRIQASFAGLEPPRCPRRRVPDAGRAVGFPSTFPPRDAKTRGTGRNRWGQRVMVGAVSVAFVLVTADGWGPVGVRRDLRGAEFAACKIAG